MTLTKEQLLHIRDHGMLVSSLDELDPNHHDNDDQDVLRALCDMALASLSGSEPVAWVRTLNGEIDWAEDCLSDHDRTDDWTGYDDGYKYVPLYARPQGQGWIAMESAPLDGTEIEVMMRHPHYWLELKLHGKASAEELWQQVVRAKWIDHNGGGWTWHGIAGTPVGWRPLSAPPGAAR